MSSSQHFNDKLSGWWFGTWLLWLSHHIGNGIIIPTDSFIFFRGLGQPPTRWWFCTARCQKRMFVFFQNAAFKMHGASGSPGQVHELKMYFAGQPGCLSSKWGEFQPCVGWPASGVPGDFSGFWAEKGKSGMSWLEKIEKCWNSTLDIMIIYRKNVENQSCRWLMMFLMFIRYPEKLN